VSRTRTRIVCTIGPASASAEQLDRLVRAGMDVARLNFSHGTHAEHAEVIARLRDGEARWGRPVAILQDLQGPKIRLGTFGARGGRRVDLEPGASFTLTGVPGEGTIERASVVPPECLSQVRAGDQILMDDGLIQLRAEAVVGSEVRCRVLVGGRISDHKGVAIPRVPLPVSCLTEKDRADLRFGIAHGVDFLAVSFVRTAEDIAAVRGVLRELGAEVPIVAKLERQEVMANLPDILPMVDAVMVARGDLGVDAPLEEVPHLQKEILRQARAARVPVIVATQMLESMTTHARPTRAEVSDVATAIREGADAIMLSAETATGRYPGEAVEYMARIAGRAESALDWRPAERGRADALGFAEAISDAAARAAHLLRAKAIVAFTESGFSARMISQERPDVPIIALTPFAAVQRRLGLSWGVSARLVRKVQSTDEMLAEVETALLADATVAAGDVVVIISGGPIWVRGTTNLLKLHRIGERR
jgi:pyruvate kinase